MQVRLRSVTTRARHAPQVRLAIFAQYAIGLWWRLESGLPANVIEMGQFFAGGKVED